MLKRFLYQKSRCRISYKYYLHMQYSACNKQHCYIDFGYMIVYGYKDFNKLYLDIEI